MLIIMKIIMMLDFPSEHVRIATKAIFIMLVVTK